MIACQWINEKIKSKIYNMRDREMFEEKGNITHHQQFVSKSHSLCVILLIKNQNIKK